MGIFDKSNKCSSSSSNGTTIISDGTFIKDGIDTTDSSIFCNGKFEGVILAANSLTIGKTGKIIEKIKVSTLTV
jgi:cytoskeletal protein CcmA (bactofilin family)